MNKCVLLVGNFLSEAVTYGSVSEDLARRLTRRGWKVTMTSAYRNRVKRFADMLLTTWTQHRQYDVAHLDVFSGPAFLWAEAVSTMLRWLRKPYALTLRGGGLVEFAAKRPARVKRLFDSAAAVTAPSRFLLTRMQQYRQDILLLPNPLEIARYTFTVRTRPRPRIVWLRAFHEIYNPSMVPAILVELADHPDAEVIMVGPDKGDGSLGRTREMARVLGVDSRITFAGPVPKDAVSSWLNRGDIFLNTTNVDNTPTSVLEAMACGLCVASTCVGGIPYLLEDQVDALLVPPQRPEAMAAAIRRILNEPGLAERLSTNARRKVEDFEWSRVLPQWEELLGRIAAQRR